MKPRISPTVAKPLFAIAATFCLASLAWASLSASSSTSSTTTVTTQTTTIPSTVAAGTDVAVHYDANTSATPPASGCSCNWGVQATRDGCPCTANVDYQCIVSSASPNSSVLDVSFTPLTTGNWTLTGSCTASNSCAAARLTHHN